MLAKLWYQPSEKAYLLAELVPAQRAGLPAHRAGTSPASRPTCSPSGYQPSKQAYLLAKLVPQEILFNFRPRKKVTLMGYRYHFFNFFT
jgi:hypothetical protein